LAVRSKQPLSNHDFLARVREYLPMDAAVWEIDEQGKPSGNGLFGDIAPNVFYRFDFEAFTAVAHAVEDVALDEAKGALLAAFQEFSNFAPHRERYWQLGATIDDVLVLGSGKAPRRHGHLRFQNIGQSTLREFRFVLHQGPRHQVMLVCRQSEGGRTIEERKYAGFYTLDPGLITRVREEILELDNSAAELKEFSRLQALDLTAKRIDADFLRQKEAVDGALRRLQVNGEYGPDDFVSDFDKALDRLQQWRTRLPKMLVHQL
jgi:hypothetical protein